MLHSFESKGGRITGGGIKCLKEKLGKIRCLAGSKNSVDGIISRKANQNAEGKH